MGVPPAKRVEIPQEWLEEIRAKDEFFRTVAPDELARYRGKWIATKRGQVVAVAPTLETLDRQLVQQGVGFVCRDFIEEPRYVIYAVR